MDLQKYFYPDYEFYLDHVRYDRKPASESSYQLKCTDNINATISGEMLNIIITRSLVFEPDEVFSLSVSFGANLKFKEELYREVDWSKINLSEEFKNNGNFVLSNISNRISALIANITSSFGQVPIVLPPAFVTSN